MRMLTTTVAIREGIHPRISVVSNGEIPRNAINECLALLYTVTVTAPVKRGQVIAANICGTGVDIVASRSMKHI